MGLINCPDCGKEVSERADACPECGGPMTDEDVQTIEQTGKKWKIFQLVGALILTAGMVGCMAGEFDAGSMGFLSGFIVIICVRMGAWWEHG